ncbi:hypothetical protein F5882DRAFT_401510 [Hyaloscypha sp. PMI_1271]|nr:hypothetical protein F5882DRAFT_401510 [Hyaloscypha sp. PMI_1271]
MTVTKALSIQYLWVDRLCILQDDQDALNHEISKMSSIYACSTFTIIAGSGPNDQHGIPGVVSPRNISHTAVRFNSSWLFAFDDPEWHEGRDIWHTRAWTFQERLVPQRCLVFYKNSVKWECGRHSRHELFEKGGSIRDKHLGIKSRPWPDVRQYTNLVRAYTSRQLSFQNDAMNAFSAVLHTLEPSFPGGFTFGLPDFLFDQFLTWRPGLRQVQRVNFLSWSWLGWQGNMEPGWMSADWEPTLMWAPRYRYISRSMIKWQKEDRTTLAKVTIESTASKWLLFKGHWYLNDELPDGWEEVPGSINTYRHKTLSNSELGLEEGDHLYHPVPIRSCVEDSKPIDLLRWSPILRGRALVSKLVIGDLFVQSKLDGNNPFHTTGLFIKTKPITGPTTSEPVCFDLLDTGFNWCGMILANDLAPEAHARELPAKSWPFQRAQSKAARKVKKDGKEELYRKELEM